MDDIDLGVVYREARARVVTLVRDLPDATQIPVPACPEWSVHGVVSHLVAVVEDVLAGRLTGPPTDEQTAAQVARRRDISTAAVLGEWEALAPPFEEFLSTTPVWPAALDVLSHEQDIRGAVDRPGARDVPGIRQGADLLIGRLQPPVDLLIRMEDAEHALGPSGAGADVERLELTTTRFEAFRFRLGRRSRAQLASLAWSGDPAAVLDQLTIFGPSPLNVIE
jgi:uncharacterized protein (TIGR03083 family)